MRVDRTSGVISSGNPPMVSDILGNQTQIYNYFNSRHGPTPLASTMIDVAKKRRCVEEHSL